MVVSACLEHQRQQGQIRRQVESMVPEKRGDGVYHCGCIAAIRAAFDYFEEELMTKPWRF